MRPRWEILVGEQSRLAYLADQQDQVDNTPHPLQETVEELIETLLTEDEQEIYRLRFGEQLAFREIARQLGYKSHRVIQIQVERIIAKIKNGLEATTGNV